MAREKGTVKWFSTDKGYGFIRRESGDEIFVHHTDIEVDGYAALKNGETVEFDVFESDRGPKARNLIPLDADGTRPAPRAKASEGGSKEGRKSSRKRRGGPGPESRETQPSARPEPDMKPAAAEGKKPLAQLLRERLGKRFPGFGG
jgi:CspA family cold shock protein